MLHRLKRALVDSYVGAIALGYLLAEGLEQIAMVITAPFSAWIRQEELHRIYPQGAAEPGFRLQASVLPLVHGVLFLLFGLVLLRWLYYPAKVNEVSEPVSGADEEDSG
jgi:hypothetical protein